MASTAIPALQTLDIGSIQDLMMIDHQKDIDITTLFTNLACSHHYLDSAFLSEEYLSSFFVLVA